MFMTTKKNILLASALFLLSSTTTFWAYKEIDCSTNASFTSNSCNQCFEWWSKKVWDNIWMLSDQWVNPSDSDQVFLKEENSDFPTMINLSDWKVEWKPTLPAKEFWEYTPEFEKLKSEADAWYVLPAGQKVTWLKSKVDAAFTLTKNTAKEWTSIGLMVYPIKVHNIVNWAPSIDSKDHRECVLYKSSESTKTEVVVKKTTPKKLPKTWPETYVLILLTMFLSLWILKSRKK